MLTTLNVSSDEVFKHRGGTWEWAMVLGIGIIFMIFAEIYKLLKRTFLPPLVTHVQLEPRNLEGLQVDATAGGTIHRRDSLPLPSDQIVDSKPFQITAV